jgi:hypothetical membrane protein
MSSTRLPAATRGEPSAQRRPTAPGTWIGLTGVGTFLVAGAAIGLVTPGYHLRREAVSGLAALDSPHAGWMIAGFVLGAVGLVAGAAVLWQAVPQRSGRVAAAMVAGAGVLIGAAGFARQDCSDQVPSCRDFGEAVEASGSYWTHEYASLLAFLLLIVSSFVLARGLCRTGRAGLAAISRIAGVVCLMGVALLVVTPSFVVDNYGIAQRLVVAVLFGWPVAAGLLASRRA